ncbi:unnamed protein product [Psylliodes chrysocephalus]|uniref:Uncharacterized protein n=1 Tax=Psylliodes chrysocephalus TaxID=3402493 RepID=A0A9P0D0N9_9CUCU|nr:unnamed protein product [Psylliodes chrysocephala]
MERCLLYIGGGAGALALTGVAAASAYYLTKGPSCAPERPLFPLEAQCIEEEEHELKFTTLELISATAFRKLTPACRKHGYLSSYNREKIRCKDLPVGGTNNQ